MKETAFAEKITYSQQNTTLFSFIGTVLLGVPIS